jgi:3-oxoacyl-[acyl-carrier-protein] synthase II
MLYAVERADLSPTDISHINAHATSTPVGDVAEYNAIKRAFGDHTDNLSVTATKSMTGHLLGAAGALEAVITIQSIFNRLVPATINLDDQDPEIALNVVREEHQKLPDGDIAALNNSFGFGGHNVALAIRSI